MGYVRSKKKPPKDATCDAHVGLKADAGMTPQVIRCKNPATVELLGGGFPRENWFCEACAKRLMILR